MKSPMRRLLLTLLAILIASVSLPLAFISVDSLYGLGSFLLVPTFVIAVVFTIAACNRSRRIWWFAFACVVGLWLQVCPSIQSGINNAAISLQKLTQEGTISLSQRVIEPTAILLICFTPLIGAILTGTCAGWAAQRRMKQEDDAGPQASRLRWQISIRELLVGIAAVCVLFALVLNRTRTWQKTELQNQRQFLARFETSFRSGTIRLLESPTIEELQRTLIPESGYGSFMPPEVNEYRVTAPIKKQGMQCWAIWAYTCNGKHDDMIYKFAYGEAPAEDQLPSMPFPRKTYVGATWTMVDGIPK